MLSRRRFLWRGLVASLGALLAACAAVAETIAPSPRTDPPPSARPTPSPAATHAGPSLRQTIASLLLVGFRGLTPDEAQPTRGDIAERGLGGVILFSVDQPTGGDRNVASPDQVRELVAVLSAASSRGLIVAVDQEGGQVARLGPRHGFPATPSAAEMGRASPAETRAAARGMAETLRAGGVTLNLAPVVDLAINPDNPIIAAIGRSFSADPAVVTDHAAAFIDAHHDLGVRCAIKHFPGQGSAGADTHLGVVDVTDAWTEVELEPFASLIAAGGPDAVMSAHIFNARLDPAEPATLSRPTITGLLRDRLGFHGPVISDDMQMRAITDVYGYPEAVARALEAGIDLLLVANQIAYEPDIVADTIDIIAELVRSGRISEAQLRASAERVDRLRA